MQFDKYFSEHYSEDRWLNQLLPALKEPTKYCCLINQFAEPQVVVSLLDRRQSQLVQVPFISIPCLQYTEAEVNEELDKKKPFPMPQRDFSRDQLKSYYLLDAASVLLSEVLSIKPGMRILDLCAAPGGKSLSLALHLFSPLLRAGSLDGDGQDHDIVRGRLVCNEISIDRRKRLQTVLKDYLPSRLYNPSDPRDSSSSVQVTGCDGCRYSHTNPHFVEYFDRVLLDAPCSSERHLIHNNLNNTGGGSVDDLDWSVNKSRNMAQRQTQLLMEALECLKPNGLLVYATCSLSPIENDQVIQKCIEKLVAKKCSYTVSCAGRKWKSMHDATGQSRFPIGEPTGLGWIVLPDNSSGHGPLYFSLLMKKPIASHKAGR